MLVSTVERVKISNHTLLILGLTHPKPEAVKMKRNELLEMSHFHDTPLISNVLTQE